MKQEGRVKRVNSAVDSTYRGFHARKLSSEEAAKIGLDELPPGQAWGIDMFGRSCKLRDLGWHPARS